MFKIETAVPLPEGVTLLKGKRPLGQDVRPNTETNALRRLYPGQSVLFKFDEDEEANYRTYRRANVNSYRLRPLKFAYRLWPSAGNARGVRVWRIG